MKKKMKFQGLVLNEKGELVRSEIYGPDCYEQWLRSYRVLRACLIMLKAVDPAVLDMYADRVSELNRRYGSTCWAIVYQGDVRCRREHHERLRDARRRRSKRNPTILTNQSAVNHVWMMSVTDSTWWSHEVVEPAVMVMSRATSLNSQLAGDAPVGSLGGGVKRPAETQVAGTTPKRKAAPVQKPFLRVHNIGRDGRLTTNRRGRSLCAGWQSGSCTETRGDGLCAVDRALSHQQCAICLSNSHGADKCNNAAAKQPNKGKGKNKTRSQNLELDMARRMGRMKALPDGPVSADSCSSLVVILDP